MHSARLKASQRVRHLALHDATPAEVSRALLSELATLLASYQIRGELVDVNDGTVAEVVSQVSANRLRSWWAAHAGGLLAMHREVASAFLADVAVRVN